MENRRRRGQSFAVFLLLVIVMLFGSILAALVFAHLQGDEKTALVGWGGTLIGALGTAISYEWGSSKGSAMKDELAAAQASGTQRVQAEITTTVKPAEETKL